jgi:alpha-D-xyloside xylohydrolase
MPYIYSEAWQVSKRGSTMMRPLVMDFSNDTKAMAQECEYMFGKAMLIAPVTAPASSWEVYLPKSTGWYNFWTGKKYNGGQTIIADAPQDKIPVFVKAGSIIPMGKLMQFTGQKSNDTLEIRIYKGADASFTLYEDEGDNYNYEKGKYSNIAFTWNEKMQTLTVGDLQGAYPGSLTKRVFNIVFVGEGNGSGVENANTKKAIIYTGTKLVLNKTK